MKRTKLKSKSKQNVSVLQRKIWVECRRIIKKRYENKCYSCGKEHLDGRNYHIGHLYPKASLGAYLKYDLRVLRPQCMNCNINLGGNGARYLENMERIEGKEYIESIKADMKITVKATDHYQQLLEKYKNE